MAVENMTVGSQPRCVGDVFRSIHFSWVFLGKEHTWVARLIEVGPHKIVLVFLLVPKKNNPNEGTLKKRQTHMAFGCQFLC